MDDKNPFIIQDRETLKVMADPLRHQIIELLIDSPQTIKQVADKLGLAPSKLYYHFNLLEKHGLLKVMETRMVSNLMERSYQAVASCFELAPGLLTTSTDEGKAAVNEAIVSTIDATRDDILRSLQARYFQLEQGAPAQPRRMMLTRQVRRIPETRVTEFQERLETLLKDFTDAESPPGAPETRAYAIMVAFYPNFYFEETPNG